LTCYVWFLRFAHNYWRSVYLSAATRPNSYSAKPQFGPSREARPLLSLPCA
jgi:hypothetical protein